MFAGYKTYITAGLGVITAVASYLMGEMALADAIQVGLTAVMGAFIRHGVSTETKK